MIIRTYFSKNNTIVSNSPVNTGLNPITELFYGDGYSRFLFYFDETRIKSFYTGGTFADLTKLTHTLRMTNTGSFDKELLNTSVGGKERTSSFDLILFNISQEWDNGVGYDYTPTNYLNGEGSYYNGASNWVSAQTGIEWSAGTGVYSGSPSGITITSQHFDFGNENIEMDITAFVNGVLTGDTNYGLGIAYNTPFEQMTEITPQYVGFFTNNTQTFYEPFIETKYNNVIKDDRNNFYQDVNNNLYLYVNVGGSPTNLDTLPGVLVYDQDGNLFSSFTPSAVTQVSKGVYSIDLLVPTSGSNACTTYNDVWTGLTINGVLRPNVTLSIPLKSSNEYYNIGSSSVSDSSSNNGGSFINNVSLSVSNLQNKESIIRGDIRKVVLSARIPYTVNQTANLDSLEYRIYVKEGNNQLTIMGYEQVNLASPDYYFLLDTMSLLPNTYYIDIKIISNMEVVTKTEVISFDIVSLVDHRKSQ